MEQIQLLTSKPLLYACNVLEEDAVTGNKFTELVAKKGKEDGTKHVIISSKIEADIAILESGEENSEFLNSMVLVKTGLSKIIKEMDNLLDLRSFFTVGPKETHGWTVSNGTLAPQAAGIIHTDFDKGFIQAEVISYEDYINFNGELKAKEMGKMRYRARSIKYRLWFCKPYQ